MGVFVIRPAFAGTVTGATISGVLASGTNGVFIYVNIPPSGYPSCATSTASAYRFVVNLAQPGGASIVATALSAHATGTEVDIVGTGACDVWSDTETINYILEH